MEKIQADNTHERPYRRLQVFIMSCLLGYIVISITSVFHGFEPYFFFSWFVFSEVPSDHQIAHDIILLSVNGRNLPEPVSLLSARDTFALASINSPEYERRYDIFAREAKRPTNIDPAKQLIDSLIIPATATYELVEQTFNPIERWKNGTIDAATIIGTFEKNI